MTFIEFAEKVLGIELLDWQKVVLEKAQKCKDDGKSFYINTDARAGKMLLNNIYQQKLGYDRGCEDGARDFAEWLSQNYDLRFINNPDVWLDEYFNYIREKY